MAEWVRAAEVQLELHRWLTSHVGIRWTRGWVEAEMAADVDKGRSYQLLAQAEPHKLLTADAIWVSPEISEVITVAREGFRPEPIEREDFITPTGFTYFAEPMYLNDRNKKKVSVGAISWCPVTFKENPDKWGMSIGLFSSARAEEDDFSAEHRDFMREYAAPELVPLHYAIVEFGDVLDTGHLLDSEGRYTGADEWWSLIQTTLRLMQQRVSEPSSERLPRASRRRMERAGHGIDEVLVIRLRRPTVKTGEEEGSGREYTHRWLVDGHWRQQWYPSLQRHRQIWISPYVKGPEDKELVIKRRYYKWDR